MALLAQFIGEDAVARMTPPEIDRACDFLHAEMLKNALQAKNKDFRANISKTVAKFSTTLVTASRPDLKFEIDPAVIEELSVRRNG